MNLDRQAIESNLRLHVDRMAGLIGPRYLQKPKTIQATIGYIEGQWGGLGYRIAREHYDAIGDQATNLIVEQSGSKRADEIILLGGIQSRSYHHNVSSYLLNSSIQPSLGFQNIPNSFP